VRDYYDATPVPFSLITPSVQHCAFALSLSTNRVIMTNSNKRAALLPPLLLANNGRHSNGRQVTRSLACLLSVLTPSYKVQSDEATRSNSHHLLYPLLPSSSQFPSRPASFAPPPFIQLPPTLFTALQQNRDFSLKAALPPVNASRFIICLKKQSNEHLFSFSFIFSRVIKVTITRHMSKLSQINHDNSK
jgi:hypothetical protein